MEGASSRGELGDGIIYDVFYVLVFPQQRTVRDPKGHSKGRTKCLVIAKFC
jgi:hypothetical protein